MFCTTPGGVACSVPHQGAWHVLYHTRGRGMFCTTPGGVACSVPHQGAWHVLYHTRGRGMFCTTPGGVACSVTNQGRLTEPFEMARIFTGRFTGRIQVYPVYLVGRGYLIGLHIYI